MPPVSDDPQCWQIGAWKRCVNDSATSIGSGAEAIESAGMAPTMPIDPTY